MTTATPEVRVGRSAHVPDDVERILGGLAPWFGRPEANAHYIDAARELETWTAVAGRDVVGVILIRRHGDPRAAEIELMAVQLDRHRCGIGRRLIEAVSADLAAEGVDLLSVKTLGPSLPDENYDRTRRFYEGCGFIALEELIDLWGEGTPALMMAKCISPAG